MTGRLCHPTQSGNTGHGYTHNDRAGKKIGKIGAIMKVSVKLGEPLWRQVGERTVHLEWDQPSVTMAQVLLRLEREYAGFGPAYRGEEFHVSYPYALFINARLARREEADSTSLQDGDKLFVFIPVVGG